MPWPLADHSLGFTSLSAAAATGAGKALAVAGCAKFGLQVILGSGAPATAVVKLEGSNDGATWFVLLTWDVTTPQTSGDILFTVDKPVAQIRANCTTLTTGVNKTATAILSAV